MALDGATVSLEMVATGAENHEIVRSLAEGHAVICIVVGIKIDMVSAEVLCLTLAVMC